RHRPDRKKNKCQSFEHEINNLERFLVRRPSRNDMNPPGRGQSGSTKEHRWAWEWTGGAETPLLRRARYESRERPDVWPAPIIEDENGKRIRDLSSRYESGPLISGSRFCFS